MANCSNDLENWMAELPYALKAIPIVNLAIPGSHDSMSYGIRPSAKVAPDAEPAVSRLYKVMPCVIRRWAVTQSLNATQQLMNGIRYFDLRICMNRKDNNFYFVHGLFCEEITGPLQKIKAFLDDHPKEFIVFDCQHFYNFSNGDYGRLERIFMKIFDDRFWPRNSESLSDLTLLNAYSGNKQVLVIYRYWEVPPMFWPSGNWPTPWPNQISVKKLKTSLELLLKDRSPDTGFVTQCVLTPPPKFIVPRFYSSLRKTCALKVNNGLSQWIESQRPGSFQDNDGQPTVNVFIADFIELNDFEFCRIVVDLNCKLMPNISEDQRDFK